MFCAAGSCGRVLQRPEGPPKHRKCPCNTLRLPNRSAHIRTPSTRARYRCARYIRVTSPAIDVGTGRLKTIFGTAPGRRRSGPKLVSLPRSAHIRTPLYGARSRVRGAGPLGNCHANGAPESGFLNGAGCRCGRRERCGPSWIRTRPHILCACPRGSEILPRGMRPPAIAPCGKSKTNTVDGTRTVRITAGRISKSAGGLPGTGKRM